MSKTLKTPSLNRLPLMDRPATSAIANNGSPLTLSNNEKKSISALIKAPRSTASTQKCQPSMRRKAHKAERPH
jgi:hypothetical protein